MVYTQFIEGALTTSSSSETWINYNPANNDPLGEVFQANDQDIEAAVHSSEKAFQIWKAKTGAERGRVLIKHDHALLRFWFSKYERPFLMNLQLPQHPDR